MPRRAYIADLQTLVQQTGIDGVSNVRQGQDDDEFRFCLSLDDGTDVDISALVLPSRFTQTKLPIILCLLNSTNF